jgi:hypothetical protein
VQRQTWTDERLDDLAGGMRVGFERVDGELGDIRTEIRGLRSELRSEVGGLRSELRSEVGGLRSEVGELRALMFRVGVGLIVGFAGMIAAIAVNGVA